MDNYKIQQRKLMGWGEPVPFATFLSRYDASTIWDLVTREKLQVLNPENRVLLESEVADLLNQGYVTPTSDDYSNGLVKSTSSDYPSGQVEQLQLKIAELEVHMETIYDEMQQREADWIQKVEAIQKRVDRQFLAFQKKVDHKFSSLKAASGSRRPPRKAPTSTDVDVAGDQEDQKEANNNEKPND